MLSQDAFDLHAGDVLASPPHDVLLPVDEEEVAILVEVAHVTGMEPVSTQDLAGRFRVAEVAVESKRAPAEHHLADLARVRFGTILEEDPHVGPGKDPAGRAAAALLVEPGEGPLAAFGPGVPVDHRHAVAAFDGGADRARAEDEPDAHAVTLVEGSLGEAEQDVD